MIIVRHLIITTALLLVTNLSAQNRFRPFPNNLKYTTQNRDSLNATEVLEIATIARALVQKNLAEVLAQAGDGRGIWGVDQIFWDVNSARAIFLKLDVQVSAKFQSQFLTDQNSFVYHAKTPSGFDYALYFSNFSPDEAREANQAIRSSLQSLHAGAPPPTLWPQLFNQLIPCAQAATIPHLTASSSTGGEAGADVKSPPISIVQTLLACSRGVGTGAYDSTVGLATKAGAGAIKVVKVSASAMAHPIRAWQSIVSGFKSFISMIAKGFGLLKYDLGIGRTEDKLAGIAKGVSTPAPTANPNASSTPPASSVYSKLSPEDKIKFVCDLVTKVGIVGVTWAFAPANAAGLSQQVAAFMQTGVQLASFEAGRQLFMEVQYAAVAKRWGKKHQQMSDDQKKLSEEWARAHPTEAAKILAEYQKSPPL